MITFIYFYYRIYHCQNFLTLFTLVTKRGSDCFNITTSGDSVTSLEIVFNGRYVQDFLNKVSGDEVSISIEEPIKPAIWQDTAVEKWRHIIMPLRLEE